MIAALLLCFFCVPLGGLLMAFHKPFWCTQKRLLLFLSLSSGLLIGILFNEFIPHVSDDKFFASFMLLGLLTNLMVDIFLVPSISFLDSLFSSQRNSKWHEEHHSQMHHLIPCCHNELKKQATLLSSPTHCSIIGCIGLCCFFDGFNLKMAFAIDENTGWRTTMGLLLHLFPNAILLVGFALNQSVRKGVLFFISFSPSLALLAGFLSSYFLFSLSYLEKPLISFSSGVLLYTLFLHLLPVSVQNRKSLAFFMLGVLFIFLPSFLSFH